MRRLGRPVLAAALALAGCQPAPQAAGPRSGRDAGASPRPAATSASRTPGPPGTAATPSAAAGVPAAPLVALRPPAGTSVAFSGQVLVDAGYALGQGGAARLIGQDGGSLIGMDGGSMVAAGGLNMVAAGGLNMVAAGGLNMVAAGAGNLVVPAGLGAADGATLIGQDGGSLIGMDGGSMVAAGGLNLIGNAGNTLIGNAGNTLIGNAGNTLVGNAGNTLVGNSGNTYRLAQAAAAPAFGEAWPAVGMWVSVADIRTGFTVPLGLDDRGREVHTVFTDGAGRFAVRLAPEVAPFARVVARAPGRRDPRLVLDVLRPPGEDQRPVDEAAAGTTAYVRFQLASRLLAVFALDEQAALATLTRSGFGDDAAAAAQLSAVAGPGLREIQTALRESGADRMPRDRQLELALVLADRVLAAAGYATLAVEKAGARTRDPAADALIGRNVRDALTPFVSRLREAAARQLAGQPDAAARFATEPYLIDANLRLPVAGRWRIDRASDMVDFVIKEHFASGDQWHVYKGFDVMDDLGLPLLDRDLINMAGATIASRCLATLFIGGGVDGEPMPTALAGMIRRIGPVLAGLPAAPAPTGSAAPVPPSPPPLVARGPATTLGTFTDPEGLALEQRDGQTRLYVADAGAHTIRRVTFGADGTPAITLVAGLAGRAGSAPAPGQAPLTGAQARFNGPHGLALGPDGTLYVADRGNHAIRKLSFGEGDTVTVATLAGAEQGFADGAAAAARFSEPRGLAVAADGSLVVADMLNHRLRRVAPDGAVSTLMGTGEADRTEGPLPAARLDHPTAVAFAADGSLLVAQAATAAQGADGAPRRYTFAAPAIRQIRTPLEAGARSRLLAGGTRLDGDPDGFWATAWFGRPSGLALDATGRLVVADEAAGRVRLVTSPGWVQTIAGGPGGAAALEAPTAVAVAPDGALFVTDRGRKALLRLPPP